MRLIKFEELQRFGIRWSRVHVDRLQRAGKFPRKVKLSANTVGYVESEIVAFLEARLAERADDGKAA